MNFLLLSQLVSIFRVLIFQGAASRDLQRCMPYGLPPQAIDPYYRVQGVPGVPGVFPPGSREAYVLISFLKVFCRFIALAGVVPTWCIPVLHVLFVTEHEYICCICRMELEMERDKHAWDRDMREREMREMEFMEKLKQEIDMKSGGRRIIVC